MYPTIPHEIRDQHDKSDKEILWKCEMTKLQKLRFAFRSLVILRITRITYRIRRLIIRFKEDFRELGRQLRHCHSSYDIWNTLLSFLIIYFWRIYPFLYTLHEMWITFYKVMYLFNPEQWPYWIPYLRLQHLILR